MEESIDVVLTIRLQNGVFRQNTTQIWALYQNMNMDYLNLTHL